MENLEQRMEELYDQLGNEFEKRDKNLTTTIPTRYELSQSYPNPFNPLVTIPFALPKTSHVQIEIYNALGRRVATLVNQSLNAGYHTATWNGKNQQGESLASGVYFVRMKAGEYLKNQKIIMMK